MRTTIKRDVEIQRGLAKQHTLSKPAWFDCQHGLLLRQVRQNREMDRHNVSSPSVNSEALDAAAATASSRQLFAQFKNLLEAAEAKVTGYDELHAMLQSEQRSVGQLERALHMQQRHIDRFTAQDLLVSQLAQQLTVQSQNVEQLRTTCHQLSQQLESCQALAANLQQEVGQKRKRIDSLMEHGVFQEKRIRGLEKKLQQYKSLCSYIASESQVSHTNDTTLCTSCSFPSVSRCES